VDDTSKPRMKRNPCRLHQRVESRLTPNAQLPVPSQIAAIAQSHGGLPAIVHPRPISYAELTEQAQRCALFLRERGVTPGSNVVVWLACPADSIRMSLAVLFAGAAFVPLEERTPLVRAEAIIERSDAVLVIVEGQRALTLPTRLKARIVAVEALNNAGASQVPIEPLEPPSGGDAAYVIFTSGSTGEPKGVAISHDNLSHLVRARTQLYGDKPLILPTHPCSFDPFHGAVWWALARAGTLALLRTPELSDLELIAELIHKHELQTLSVVPSLYEALLKGAVPGTTTAASLKSLATVIIGGEALPFALAGLHHAELPGCVLSNEYGPTEATVVSTSYQVPSGPPSPIPIGKPLLDVECHVVREDGRLCAVGEPGELYIGGKGVAIGYLHRPDLNAVKFLNASFANNQRVYRTGDRVCWNERGELDFFGRLDGQIKLRGNRIEPEEIEVTLQSIPGVQAVGVTVRELRPNEPSLIAFVVSDEPLRTQAFDEELRRKLPPYMIPSIYVELPSLPRTPTGKLDRAELGRLKVPEARSDAPLVPTATQAEHDLASVWAQILSIPLSQIGGNSDFFALGGHSLLFAKVERTLRRDHDLTAPLASFWSYTTLSTLATQLHPAATSSVRESVRHIDRFRLAPIQETFFYLAELAPHSAAYTVGATVRVVGKLDVERLQQAALRTYEFNAVLRARLVRRPAVAELAIQALTKRDAWFVFNEEAAESRMAAEDTAKGFTAQLISIDSTALARFQVVTLPDNEYLVSLAAHHIVVDGTSVHLIFSELWKYYRDPSAPTAGSRSYGEFALATRRRLTDTFAAQLKQKWQDQLAGLGSPSQVPHARNAPSETLPPNARSQLIVPIPGEVTQAVQTFARTRQATPFMVALAATGLVLARYQGYPEATVGTPISLRGLGDFAHTVGCMVNSAVVRMQAESWEHTFDDWVGIARQAVTDAALGSELPIASVYEALARSASDAPLFRFFFNYLDRTEESTTLEGASLVPLLDAAATPKFDITLYVHDWGSHWDLDFVFAPERYDEATIATFAAQLTAVLQQVTDGQRHQLGRLPLNLQLVSSRAESVSDEGQNDATIHAQFAARANETPDAVAIDDGQHRFAYAELAQRAATCARRIREIGVLQGAKPRVAIGARRTGFFVAAVIACLESGASYTVIDADQPAALQHVIIRAFGATLLLDPDDVFDSDLPYETLRGRHVFEPTHAVLTYLVANPESHAYTLFTSGTTGQPKGIVGAHSPVVRFLEWQASTYQFSRQDRFAFLAGLGHDPAFRDLFAPLSRGATLFIPSGEIRSNPEKLSSWLSEHRVTVAHMTPPMIELLAQTNTTLPTLRAVFCGGDRLRARQAESVFRLAPNAMIVNCYGLTETPQVIARHNLTRTEAFASVPVGTAVPGFRFELRNPVGRACETNELGEIIVHSAHLAKGKWIDGQLVPLDGGMDSQTLHTGDWGRWDVEGRLHFVRRGDRETKLRGYRISLEEIETLVVGAPNVRSARVLVHDVKGESVLSAFVIADGGRPKDRVVRAHVAARAVGAAVPRRVYVVDQFPLTRNGKLDERALIAFSEQYDDVAPPSSIRLAPGATPVSQTEELVQRHFCQCLNRAFVGMDQNFFQVGGNSIIAVQLLSKLGGELGVPISVETLMQNQTPRQLASALLQDHRDLEESLVISVNPNGTLPTLWMFHPVGGHVLFARRFGKLVGEDQPVCAIQARGLDGIREPISSMHEMVALYTSLVQQHQPIGPYYLAGPSFGGRLAVEIARTLAQQGEQVAMVALFDTYGPGFPAPPPLHERAWRALKKRVQQRFGELEEHDYQPLTNTASAGALAEAVERVFATNRLASQSYDVEFYDGPVWLFRATQLPTERFGSDFSDPTNGWGKLTRSLEIREINSTHQAMMDHPAVDELVQHFQVALKQCRSQAGHFNEYDDS
jgi:amino acid adenylation domain-containing protein